MDTANKLPDGRRDTRAYTTTQTRPGRHSAWEGSKLRGWVATSDGVRTWHAYRFIAGNPAGEYIGPSLDRAEAIALLLRTLRSEDRKERP